MTVCVLDSSVALAWILPVETNPAIDALLDQIVAGGAIAPSLWKLETANVLLGAGRRGQITLAEYQQALLILSEVPVQIDAYTAGQAWGETLALAAGRKLTVYDAAYLELALRRSLPLASLDRALRQAAAKSGVAVL